MNATSFCFAEGPRARITTVGVLPRRMPTGRSGMRIVMFPAAAWRGNGCGVKGCDATCGPELGCPAERHADPTARARPARGDSSAGAENRRANGGAGARA